MFHSKLVKHKQELIRARKAIRYKMKMLRGSSQEASHLLEKRFKPIVDPLVELVETIKTKPSSVPIKFEPKFEKPEKEEKMEQKEE